jgi:L-aspartate oxidase
MGGVETDLSGRTSLSGLYAAGECAATGAHGANRLASTSLLEAAVFGARAGRAASVAHDPDTAPLPATPAPDLPNAAVQSLRRAMSEGAGVVRDAAGLTRLVAEIAALEAAHGEALPLVAARLVAEGALGRRESRGAHFRADHPQPGPAVRSRVTLARAPAARAPAFEAA